MVEIKPSIEKDLAVAQAVGMIRPRIETLGTRSCVHVTATSERAAFRPTRDMNHAMEALRKYVARSSVYEIHEFNQRLLNIVRPAGDTRVLPQCLWLAERGPMAICEAILTRKGRTDGT